MQVKSRILLGTSVVFSFLSIPYLALAGTIIGSTAPPDIIVASWNIDKETGMGTITFGADGSGQQQNLQNIMIDDTNWTLLSFVVPASNIPGDEDVTWTFEGNEVGDTINLTNLGSLTIATFTVTHCPIERGNRLLSFRSYAPFSGNKKQKIYTKTTGMAEALVSSRRT